jgi:hypothetical protein
MATLAASPRPLAVRELARVSRVPLSTTHRLAGELIEAGVVTATSLGTRVWLELVADVPAQILTLPTELHDLGPPAGVKLIDAARLARFGIDYRGSAFVLATRHARIPPDAPSTVVRFKHGRPLEWTGLDPEDIIVGLLSVDPPTALAFAKTSHVNRARLRQRIHQEGRVAEAIKSGVADVAWRQRHYLIHMGYKF